jgi:hypothetical protein
MAFFDVAMKKVAEKNQGALKSDAFHADTNDGLVVHHAVPP